MMHFWFASFVNLLKWCIFDFGDVFDCRQTAAKSVVTTVTWLYYTTSFSSLAYFSCFPSSQVSLFTRKQLIPPCGHHVVFEKSEISKRKSQIAQPEVDLCTSGATDPIQAERSEILFLISLFRHHRKPLLKGIDFVSPGY